MDVAAANNVSAGTSRGIMALYVNLNFGRYGGGGGSYNGYAQYLAIFTPNLVAADLLAIYLAATATVAWIVA